MGNVLGAPAVVSLSPEALHALVATVLAERGVVARCPCGAATFCPLTPSGLEAYNQFDQLHARCLRAPA